MSDKTKFNHCCPYCGSDGMTADADILVTADPTEDGKLIVRHYWDADTLTKEAVASISSEDIQGYCMKCGAYCDFDWKKGFIPGDGIQYGYSVKSAATVFKNIIKYVVNTTPQNEVIDVLKNMGFSKEILTTFAKDCGLDKSKL